MPRIPRIPRIPRLTRRRLLLGIPLLLAILATVIIGIRLDWWASTPPAFTGAFSFRDGFENASKFEDLFPRDLSRWHNRQLQQPAGATPNRVELTSAIRHSGANALKFVAAPYDGSIASKADIELGHLPFTKGSHVWFSGWYYLVGGSDASLTFLWDIETSRKWQSPGRRLFLQDGESLASDLGKWWGAKTSRQTKSREIRFPKDQWVHLRVHLLLSERHDEGLLQVWQDNAQILDTHTQTLPTAKSTFDRLQLGLTANGNRKHSQTLYLDDIIISSTPITGGD